MGHEASTRRVWESVSPSLRRVEQATTAVSHPTTDSQDSGDLQTKSANGGISIL